MKNKFLVAFAFLGLLLFAAACSSTSSVDAVDDEHMDEDDHSHSPEDHMAGAHNVPEEAAAVPNPIEADEKSISAGADTFASSCAVCHGEKGLGDGPTAESLESKPADLTAGHVQGLSDGALFYIISHGRPDTPMPAWEGVLGEEERWNVVNFMRALVDEHHDDGHAEDEHGEHEHSD